MGKKVITTNPNILSGPPVFSGTRVPFQYLFDYLEAGDSIDEFLENMKFNLDKNFQQKVIINIPEHNFIMMEKAGWKVK